jgi:hypothetical protein
VDDDAPNSVTPPPVLNYARPPDRGTPDLVLAADDAIERGAPPSAIRALFRNADETLGYYARHMRRRYDAGRLADRCACCGGDTGMRGIIIRWNAHLPLPSLTLSMRSKDPNINFSTFHAVCERCGTDTLEKLGRLEKARMLLKALTIIMCIMVVILAVGLRPYSADFGKRSWGMIGGASIVAAAFCACLDQAIRRRNRTPFHTIMPAGVTLLAARAAPVGGSSGVPNEP